MEKIERYYPLSIEKNDVLFFPLSCLDVYLGYERPAEFGVKGTLTLYWSAWSYGLHA